jgi:hypothetical protein
VIAELASRRSDAVVDACLLDGNEDLIILPVSGVYPSLSCRGINIISHLSRDLIYIVRGVEVSLPLGRVWTNPLLFIPKSK